LHKLTLQTVRKHKNSNKHFHLLLLEIITVLFGLGLISGPLIASEAKPIQNIIKSHAIAMHGTPKYPNTFTHFDYTSPNALKGGFIRLYGFGTFDSLNEHIAKGNAANNLELIYDSLTKQAMDEPFTQYGLVAHTIE